MMDSPSNGAPRKFSTPTHPPTSSSILTGGFPDLIHDAQRIAHFLTTFVSHTAGENDSMQEDEHANTLPKYMQIAEAVSQRRIREVVIELEDLHTYDPQLAAAVAGSAVRYTQLFGRAFDALLPETIDDSEIVGERTAWDIFQTHREQRYREAVIQAQQAAAAAGGGADEMAALSNPASNPFPPELRRFYEIRIVPRTDQISRMRDIRAKDVGKMVSVRGIVTRVSDVQPLVQVVAYICQTCGYESYQPVNDRTFQPLQACPSEQCKRNNDKGQLIQQTRGSKFVRYQLVKLQELPHEVPVGHVPRSMNLRFEGEITRKTKPGDFVTASGIFLPMPFTGYRAIRAGLTTETYLHVTKIDSSKKSYADTVADEEMMERINDLADDPDCFEKLASSIAPEIWGHEDIKKALVLLLAGGVTREMKDGLKIRGDINVLLCGDPGVAKSQLLKHISSIAPRCIYTTGKGSSGVGLTAAVLRDPVTGDMTLEGGALVLADMGICCIDEFDKMEDSDRTAIHEVMEQQTVSIAKAGITTTLNARTSILAAANPVYSRWNPKRSIEENINLPTALLSRFDLTFVLLDRPDMLRDEELARHVTYVHQKTAAPKPIGNFEPLTPQFLRHYIARAREFVPIVPREITDFIVGSYVSLRKDSTDDDGRPSNPRSIKNTRTRFVTARSLLSVIRLAQAHARIRLRDEIDRDDVDEALRLLEFSKAQLQEDQQQYKHKHFLDGIWAIIQAEFRRENTNRLSKAVLLPKIKRKKYTEEQFEQTLQQYEDELNIITTTKTHVRLLEV